MTNSRSRDSYLRLFDEFPAPIWQVNTAGETDYCNRAWLTLTGRSLEDVLRTGWQASLHPDDLNRVTKFQADRMAARLPFEMQYRLCDGSGAYRTIIDTARPFDDLDGTYAGYIGNCYDITERERAGQVIWQYAQRLKVLNDIGRAVLAGRSSAEIAQGTLSQLMLFVPCQYANVIMFEENSRQATVLAAERVNVDPLQAGARTLFSTVPYRVLRGGRPTIINDLKRIKKPSADLRALLAAGLQAFLAAPLLVQGTLIGALNCFARDPDAFAEEHLKIVSEAADQLAVALEHARLFEEVLVSREQSRQLAQQVVLAQEEERRNLSRELHDEAGQALTALRLSLELAQMQAADNNFEAVRRSLAEAVVLTASTMVQVRQLAHDLRPPALDALGLGPALEDMCRNLAERKHIQIEYAATDLPELPDAVKMCLYRFVQESLTNVVKHAHAKEVRVLVSHQAGTVRISVEDDGVGFDRAGARAGVPVRHLGLIGMHERVERLGGQLSIVSRPGAGTLLTAEVPCQGAVSLLPGSGEMA